MNLTQTNLVLRRKLELIHKANCKKLAYSEVNTLNEMLNLIDILLL